MTTCREASVSFEESDTRAEEMHRTIEEWIDDLVTEVDEAQSSEAFRERLDVQSRFHEYSYRNTLLIKHQYPAASKVAGYRTWQEEFDRYDAGFYENLAIRACEAVVFPLGWRLEDINQHIEGMRDVQLTGYQ